MFNKKITICLFLLVLCLAFSVGATVPRLTTSMDGGGYPVPVVSDSATGLMWQGCAVGMAGDGVGCAGSGTTFSKASASSYCTTALNADFTKNGGYADWYLPDAKELYSIVNNRFSNPNINGTFFPNTPVDAHFWTDNFVPGSGDAGAYSVDFSNGTVSSIGSGNSHYFRCVRKIP